MPLSIQIFLAGGILLIVAMIALVAGTLLWPFDTPGASHSRISKKTQAIGLATAVIAGFLFWSRSYWYDEVDSAIVWAVLAGSSQDMDEVMESILPNDVQGAIVVLRKSGFVEGWYSVGAVYHRQPLPQPGETSDIKLGYMRSLNSMLKIHSAVSIRKFYTSIPDMTFFPVRVTIYLLKKDDGSLIVSTEVDTGIIFVF